MAALPILFLLAVTGADGAEQIKVQTVDGKPQFVVDLPKAVRPQVPDGDLSQETGEKNLRLQLKETDGRLGPSIFATYKKRDGRLKLAPRFGLVPGQSYLATFLRDGRAVATRLHRIPVAYNVPPPIVNRIFPTINRLPANHLKFYIHFSQPMREGRAIFEQIRLLDSSGQQIHDPWRRQELWNSDATRLTLWVHPGRVKTGVNLRDEEGPVLRPGKTYTLEITGDVRGQDGQSLKIYRKTFATIADDRQRPLPSEWKVSGVQAGTREPIRVQFGEPLDAAIAIRALRIYAPDGKQAPGKVRLDAHQAVWQFTPTAKWLHDDYRILVADDLEDLAGNTPLRVFDTDLTKAAPRAAVLDLGFRPTTGK
jgi:hypothetical protein